MTQIVTPEAILSFPNLFKPRAYKDGKQKFEATLVFTEGTDISELRQAVADLLVEKFGKDIAAKLVDQGKLRLPFKTGATEWGYPEGNTHIGTTASVDYPPVVVSQIPDKDGKPTVITDPKEVYSGSIVKALVRPFYYPAQDGGKQGVSFGLNGVQKIRDGERMDGQVDARNVFQADPAALAKLDALADTSGQEDEEPAGTRDVTAMFG